MSRVRLAVLLPALLLGLAPGTRAGEAEAPPESGEAEAPPAPGEAEALPAAGGAETPPAPAEDTWLDVSHAFLERTLLAPVVRFDRFFSDERELEVERARSFRRWRNEIRVNENVASPSFTTGIRANLRFPGINRRLRRLRIVVAGDTTDTVSALFPEEGAKPGAPPATEEAPRIGSGDAGLRLDLLDTLLASVSLGGGILLEMPPGAYGRVRVKWAVPVPRVLLSRWALTGFWRTDTRLGASGLLDLERPFAGRYLARLSGAATVTEESTGLEWAAEAALLAAIGPRSGAALGGGPSGTTGSPVDVDRWRVYTRIRSDVYRRWIFVEAEPEVAWPWTPERGRHATFSLAFRLEVQFQGPAPHHETKEAGTE